MKTSIYQEFECLKSIFDSIFDEIIILDTNYTIIDVNKTFCEKYGISKAKDIGYGICKQIKSNEKLRDIPLFYISAFPEYVIKEIFDETQANGYFLKPFNLSEFDILFTYLQNHLHH